MYLCFGAVCVGTAASPQCLACPNPTWQQRCNQTDCRDPLNDDTICGPACTDCSKRFPQATLNGWPYCNNGTCAFECFPGFVATPNNTCVPAPATTTAITYTTTTPAPLPSAAAMTSATATPSILPTALSAGQVCVNSAQCLTNLTCISGVCDCAPPLQRCGANTACCPLPTSPVTADSAGPPVGAIAGGVVGALALVALAVSVFVLWKRRVLGPRGSDQKREMKEVPPMPPMSPMPPRGGVDGVNRTPHWFFLLLAQSSGKVDATVMPYTGTPMIALGSYTPMQLDEIAISNGNVVELKQVFPDGWAIGINLDTRAYGLLPLDVLQLSAEASRGTTIISSSQVPRVESQSLHMAGLVTSLQTATSANLGSMQPLLGTTALNGGGGRIG
ncbi:hypothetical protein M427DRAFT_51503 [Gonapodya prolifera JEL478]|uniref:SH3 domain-containing protein n=1 Tax=Gonapodya prolifera (strain JEL478) TaxID=1344416 RepID=A0A139AX24_GONPJ|nr:hypothetical protein M427DRAFT_51503 [Gonapodya prolifera JEL478]|eukprot:KXS21254.1 hypothetical protein M427DRAFT_51503 [Gonapodya prolifera JEL478]